MLNRFRKFDEQQRRLLENYVYVLRDPRDGKVFYVGRGAGDRVFDHFIETESLLPDRWSAKNRQIAEIWSESLDVGWNILRYGLDSLLAQHIESATIDVLNRYQSSSLLNEVGGLGGGYNGILTEIDALKLAAPPVNPAKAYSTVFVLPIENGLRERGNYYDATRRWWKVRRDKHNVAGAMAVGLIGGVSHKVYSIDRWQPSDGKHEFIGELEDGHELEGKNWRAITSVAGYWARGNYLIVEFNGKGQFRIVHGAQDKATWRSLT